MSDPHLSSDVCRLSSGPPSHAMLLAAGLGTRMRPLTEHTAKPMLPLGGKPLLDHALERLGRAGVEQVVVNTHWQAAIVAAHLAGRSHPAVTLRPEPELFDTGGSVAAAFQAGQLGKNPFLVINGDAFWLDGPHPALTRLFHGFDPEKFDVRLLLHRTHQVHAETGPGDFSLDELGIPARRAESQIVPYIYAGLQLVSPALLAHAPAAPFSMNHLWNHAIAAGRAQAIVHDGLWFHLSTPADLTEAEYQLQARATGETR